MVRFYVCMSVCGCVGVWLCGCVCVCALGMGAPVCVLVLWCGCAFVRGVWTCSSNSLC